MPIYQDFIIKNPFLQKIELKIKPKNNLHINYRMTDLATFIENEQIPSHLIWVYHINGNGNKNPVGTY